MALSKDDQNRYCGFLDLDTSSGAGKAYKRHFFVLDHQENQLLYYPDNPKLTNVAPLGYFDLQYLSMVEDAANFKAKNPLCLVLTVSGKAHYLKASYDSDKLQWIKVLQDVAKIKVTHRLSNAWDGSYKADIAGGVLIKQQVAEESDSESDSDSVSEKNDSTFTLSQKPLKTGYCIKQGAIIKTWKRRWFILAEGGLAYYRSHEVKTPIRVIPSPDIVSARKSIGIHMNKENLFEVVTPSRVFYIQAETPHDCEQWIDEITRMLKPPKRSSEAVIQTDLSGTLRRPIRELYQTSQIKIGKETPC